MGVPGTLSVTESDRFGAILGVGFYVDHNAILEDFIFFANLADLYVKAGTHSDLRIQSG